jgi:hypothetical protein
LSEYSILISIDPGDAEKFIELLRERGEVGLGTEKAHLLDGAGTSRLSIALAAHDRDESRRLAERILGQLRLHGIRVQEALHFMPAEGLSTERVGGGALFRLWLDPGDAPPESVADVLRALSDLHLAAGGSGLRYQVDEESSQIIATAEDPA